MAKKIEAWEAEVDNGSATPTPPKKPAPPAPKPKAKAKEKTYPIGQTEDDPHHAVITFVPVAPALHPRW